MGFYGGSEPDAVKCTVNTGLVVNTGSESVHDHKREVRTFRFAYQARSPSVSLLPSSWFLIWLASKGRGGWVKEKHQSYYCCSASRSPTLFCPCWRNVQYITYFKSLDTATFCVPQAYASPTRSFRLFRPPSPSFSSSLSREPLRWAFHSPGTYAPR
jgi:hypothetical protein